jgi:hypothetical protein
MRDIVSSYDNTNDMGMWRSSMLSRSLIMMEAALTEIKQISEDLRDIANAIDDNLKDRAEIAQLVTLLCEKRTKLDEANRRYHFFKNEVDSFGG